MRLTHRLFRRINTSHISLISSVFLFFFLGPHNMAPVFFCTEDTGKGTVSACPVQCCVHVLAEVLTVSVTTGRSHVQLFGNPGFEFSS